MAGSVAYAGGVSAYALFVDGTPHWATHWLPFAVLVGLGIGLTLPVLGGAASHSLPPGQYGVGAAVNSSFRQLGAVLGISIFVAVLGKVTPPTAVHSFHRVWWVLAALGLSSGLVWLVPRQRTADLTADLD
jgi:MFS family permease